MTDGYRVDTDELDALVTRLRDLQRDLGETGARARYGTVLECQDLGSVFAEAMTLYQAHDQMQSWLSTTIGDLERLVDDLGTKTRSVTDSYRENEHRTTDDLTRSPGRPRMM